MKKKYKHILDVMTVDRALKVARKKSESKEVNQAISIYNEILKKFPGNAKAKLGLKSLENPNRNEINLLVNLYQKKNFQSALLYGRELLKIYPRAIILYNIMGAAHAALLQFQEAASCFRKVIEIKPKHAEAYYNLANVLRDNDDPTSAIKYFKKAIDIKSDYGEAYYNLANILRDEGNSSAAIEHFKKAIKINPNYSQAYNNLGSALLDKGYLNGSIDVFRNSLKIGPEIPETHYNIGVAQLYKGDVKNAAISFKRAVEIKSNYANAYWNLYGTSTNINEAQYWIECCLQADSSYEVALLTSAALKAYKGDKKDLEELKSSKFKDHHYMRSFDWVFSLPKTPKLFFNKWSLFKYAMKQSIIDRPFYEFGVFRGDSFRFLIGTYKMGYGFDTFTGLPEDWHDRKKGSYSSEGDIPKIDGGHFVVGKFESSLPKFFNQKRPLASIINFDADLYSSTICALNYSKQIIDENTILIFDEFLINKTWEQDEYKALTEFCSNNGLA